MDLIQAVKSGFRKFFTLSGRASRSEYWCWVLFCLLVSIPIAILDMESSTSFKGTPSLLCLIFIVVSTFFIGVRRVHDVDKSGWWVLVPYVLVPAGFWAMMGISIGVMFAGTRATETFDSYMFLLGNLLFFLPLTLAVMLFCERGTEGRNRFGSDPLSAEQNHKLNAEEAFAKMYEIPMPRPGEKLLLVLTIIGWLILLAVIYDVTGRHKKEAEITKAPVSYPARCPEEWLNHKFYDQRWSQKMGTCIYKGSVSNSQCEAMGGVVTPGAGVMAWCQKFADESRTVLLSIELYN